MSVPRRKKTSASARPAEPSQKGELVNLEMKGDRLKVYSLQTLLTNKKSKETRATAKLGDVLLPWFEKVVSKPGEKLEGITELWMSLVPAGLLSRSRIVGLNRGVLTVALDSAMVRAELEARLRGGLLRELQTASRGSVFKVKTCIQGTGTGEL